MDFFLGRKPGFFLSGTPNLVRAIVIVISSLWSMSLWMSVGGMPNWAMGVAALHAIVVVIPHGTMAKSLCVEVT